MTSTNLWTIKEGIQTTLRASTDVVDAIRRDWIQIGLPSSAKFEGLVYPCLFITNARRLQTRKPYAAPSSNALSPFKNYLTFQIIIMARAKNAQKVEEQLDEIQKFVLDALGADITLGLSTVEEAIAISIESYPIGNLKGQPLDGRLITLQVMEVS